METHNAKEKAQASKLMLPSELLEALKEQKLNANTITNLISRGKRLAALSTEKGFTTTEDLRIVAIFAKRTPNLSESEILEAISRTKSLGDLLVKANNGTEVDYGTKVLVADLISKADKVNEVVVNEAFEAIKTIIGTTAAEGITLF